MRTKSEDKNVRILVIDDNSAIHEDFRKILCDSTQSPELEILHAQLFEQELKPEGKLSYSIDSAYQGQEGFEMIREAVKKDEPYMLVFVDMRMPPGWDGLETIEQILMVDKEIQIVICTAFTDYSWTEIYDRFGQIDNLLILKKPFDPSEVCQLVCALTEKWKLGRQARLKLSELEDMVFQRTLELESQNEQLEAQIAQRLAAEDQLRHDAMHDSLTNLSNRAMLLNQLEECVRGQGEGSAGRFAVLFLDIDNFKVINDSLGHTAGDKLLIETAARLHEVIQDVLETSGSEKALVTRLGGDEFTILLKNVERTIEIYELAETILQRLAEPYVIGDHELVISSSIGIAMSGDDRKTAEDILRDADTAMYRAKLGGRAQYSVFDEAMHTEVITHLKLENDLRWALDRNEFLLHYQPIINLSTGKIYAFEALVRWDHCERGLVPPDQFISILEDNGFIVRVGIWILEEACRQLHDWQARWLEEEPLCMCVNLSRRQIIEPGFVQEVHRILHETGVEGTQLKLEITESVIMNNPQVITAVLAELREMGIELYMDDFGTGHSSLSCLHQFPFDVLKIDRAFILTMKQKREYAAVVHAIVTLAHNLKMKVTAEGLEEVDQIAQMIALECDYGQGYVFSRPLPSKEAEELLFENPILRKSA